RDEDRGLRALEQGQTLGDGDLVGVVAVAGVEDFFRRADRVGEGAALVQRGDDRRPIGAPLGIAVDGAGREAEAALHGPRPLTRASARRSLRPWGRRAAAPPALRAGRRLPRGRPPPRAYRRRAR